MPTSTNIDILIKDAAGYEYIFLPYLYGRQPSPESTILVPGG